ncbi:hypothetical protein KJ068_01855 [bacterium]|nr:hypothetical protein [bacterium]
MTTIQLNVPKPIAKLHPKIREKVMLQSLRDSLNRLISEEREELKDVKLRMRRFERKYKTSFNAFEKKYRRPGITKFMRITANGLTCINGRRQSCRILKIMNTPMGRCK